MKPCPKLYLCHTIMAKIVSYLEGPEKVTRGGVNGSQLKFLTELGLCPKIDPMHLSSNSAKTVLL
jgi:hypothetical protein